MIDNSIEGESAALQQTFANLVSQLMGEEFAIKGLEALVNKENYKKCWTCSTNSRRQGNEQDVYSLL